jgi:hypothetical protein
MAVGFILAGSAWVFWDLLCEMRVCRGLRCVFFGANDGDMLRSWSHLCFEEGEFEVRGKS